MTLEELLAPFENVNIEYKYEPVKDISMSLVLHKDNVRSFLGDESCKSNVIGKDDDSVPGLFCYDA